MNNPHQFDAIINLPHHTSSTRTPMSHAQRAMQFSPFAALTGLDAAVAETARETTKRHDLDDDTRRLLDTRLQILYPLLSTHPFVCITYFVADLLKEGGAYRTKEGNLRRIDLYQRQLFFSDGTVIPLNDISAIEGDIFDDMF